MATPLEEEDLNMIQATFIHAFVLVFKSLWQKPFDTDSQIPTVVFNGCNCVIFTSFSGHETHPDSLPLLHPRLLHEHLRQRHRTIRGLLCKRVQEGFQDQGMKKYSFYFANATFHDWPCICSFCKEKKN